MDREELTSAFIQDFGTNYQIFGLSRLMGHVVGLMLCDDAPQSLDDITERLSVSKGPVSQITRRLSDHHLLSKAWVPGSRRDHYTAAHDIFGQAFTNYADKQARNLELARKYRDLLEAEPADKATDAFRRRVDEMVAFYELMGEHHEAFREAWRQRRAELAAAAPTDGGKP